MALTLKIRGEIFFTSSRTSLFLSYEHIFIFVWEVGQLAGGNLSQSPFALELQHPIKIGFSFLFFSHFPFFAHRSLIDDHLWQ